jgi:hypothetical protein
MAKKAAAARSTGLRPIHFSNRGNGRGFNFCRRSLQNCNDLQAKFFGGISRDPDVCNERGSISTRYWTLEKRKNNLKTTRAVLTTMVAVGLSCSAGAQVREQPAKQSS